ncbi:GPO family capsid scaffolding protein [Vibrio fluvialis]|nr:GPO family capsid scaffolding protein [Vibrio fluvialis]
MFKSEPICILKAGPTIDGRDIPQKVIDDIAETYDPTKYAARINDDHYDWSWKGGTVLSVEKRDDELWAEIKPNSHLLRNIENGQLLHTSCEYLEDFASSGKAYLTGLAFTDKPASLGTTQVHLSAKRSAEKALHVCTGQTVNYSAAPPALSNEDASLFQKFKSWLKGENAPEQLSHTEEEDDMNKETEELLQQQIEQNTKLSDQLGQLVQTLSAKEQPAEPEVKDEPQKSELEEKVEKLSTQLGELTTKLSSITDEQARILAGQEAEPEPYL